MDLDELKELIDDLVPKLDQDDLNEIYEGLVRRKIAVVIVTFVVLFLSAFLNEPGTVLLAAACAGLAYLSLMAYVDWLKVEKPDSNKDGVFGFGAANDRYVGIVPALVVFAAVMHFDWTWPNHFAIAALGALMCSIWLAFWEKQENQRRRETNRRRRIDW